MITLVLFDGFRKAILDEIGHEASDTHWNAPPITTGRGRQGQAIPTYSAGQVMAIEKTIIGK